MLQKELNQIHQVGVVLKWMTLDLILEPIAMMSTMLLVVVLSVLLERMESNRRYLLRDSAAVVGVGYHN